VMHMGISYFGAGVHDVYICACVCVRENVYVCALVFACWHFLFVAGVHSGRSATQCSILQHTAAHCSIK